MRRALTVILLLLFVSPLVSASGVSYYPDKQTFMLFLHSNSTFKVVPGKDPWSKGWARYVDLKLSEVKPHGDEVIVLVGNVGNNPEMARLWNLTGLPPAESYNPSVIVRNNTVFITGTKNNIYLTWEAFSSVWRPSGLSLALFWVAFFAIVLLFGLALKSSGNYAARFFLLGASTIVVWITLPRKLIPSSGFLRFFLKSLSVSAGGLPETPAEALIGKVFEFLPPTDENLWLIHWLLILTTTGLFFYMAPKRQRELGFISFGLVFATPLLRNAFGPMTLSTLGLTALVLVLAAIFNFTFFPESTRILQTLALIGTTLIGVVFNPFVAVLPLIFVITFPKRPLRNVSYLLISLAFLAFLYTKFPAWINLNPHVEIGSIMEILKESLLPLMAISYVVISRGGHVKRKGPTAFLMFVTAFFVTLSLIGLSSPAYSILLLSVLVTRAFYNPRNF